MAFWRKKAESPKQPGVRLSPKGHRFDWRPDLPDFRDVRFKLEPRRTLPPAADLRAKMPPVYNQGAEGSCVAHATAALFEYLQLGELCQPGQQAEEFDPSCYTPASRQFIYYNARVLMGTPSEDSGCLIRDAVKSAWQTGVCREALWPYGTETLFSKPHEEAYKEAEAHKISSYERCTSLECVKGALADGFPVAIGIMVFESFESDQVARSGIVPMPGDSERDLGGHAVCVVGYDDSKEKLLVRNSWGTSWGDGGHFSLPYEYLSEPGLGDDFWIVKL